AHPLFSGIFMGLWNLMSGLALAAGEMTGGALKDRFTEATGSAAGAYGWVFLLEGLGLVGCLLLLWPLKQEIYRQDLAQLFKKNHFRTSHAVDLEAGESLHDS
ncbi:MAG: PucC family protein, partial [Thermodesulfobacteriota bacterium]